MFDRPIMNHPEVRDLTHNGVMHEGKIVERGSTTQVLQSPVSDAAKELVASMPDLDNAIKRRLATKRPSAQKRPRKTGAATKS